MCNIFVNYKRSYYEKIKNIQILSDMKNISFNKTVTELLEFSLKNLDEEDKKSIEEKRKNFSEIF